MPSTTTARRRPGPAKKGARSTTRRTKREKRQSSSAIYRAVSVAVLLIFGTTTWFLLTSDMFLVSRVSVIGSHRLSQEHITGLTGLTGQNVFTINTQQARTTVAAISPIIQDVNLEYRLPNEVVISLHERPSFMAWQFGDTVYDVSSDGVVLGPWEGQEPPVRVIATDTQPLAPGEKVDPTVLELVLALQQGLPAATSLNPQEYHYSEAQGIRVITDDGLEVLIGSGDDLAGKLDTLAALLAENRANNRQLEFVDIRFLNRPYFR